MKKRVARIVVYSLLAVFMVLALSHPYVRQNIFGPKIHGEPLWAWQEEFRCLCGQHQTNPTLLGKLLSILKIDSRPLQWIGSFPTKDPEMLPVLISLADDPDYAVRAAVAHALTQSPRQEEAVAQLSRMLADPSQDVRFSVVFALRDLGPKSEPAWLNLHELLKEANPQLKVLTAVAIIKTGKPSAEADAVLRQGVLSDTSNICSYAMQGLTERNKDDEEIFALLVERSKNATDPSVRIGSIHALRWFGKKAVLHLVSLLHVDFGKLGHFRHIIPYALGEIGPDAKTAIPALESLAKDPDENVRVNTAHALKAIGGK